MPDKTTKKKDWLTKMNELGDAEQEKHGRTYDQQTREIVEYMIMFLDEQKLGDKFLRYYQNKVEAAALEAAEASGQ